MQWNIDVVLLLLFGDIVDARYTLFFRRQGLRLSATELVFIFAQSLETTLAAGVLRGKVGRSGAEMQGFVEDFIGEDRIRGRWRMDFGEERMSRMLRGCCSGEIHVPGQSISESGQ